MFNPEKTLRGRQTYSFAHKVFFAVCVCLLVAAAVILTIVIRTLVVTQEALVQQNVSLGGQVIQLVQEIQTLKAMRGK